MRINKSAAAQEAAREVREAAADLLFGRSDIEFEVDSPGREVAR